MLILSFVLDKFVCRKNLIQRIFGLLLLLGSINVMLECLMEWLMIPPWFDIRQKLLINCLSHHWFKLIVHSYYVVSLCMLSLWRIPISTFRYAVALGHRLALRYSQMRKSLLIGHLSNECLSLVVAKYGLVVSVKHVIIWCTALTFSTCGLCALTFRSFGGGVLLLIQHWCLRQDVWCSTWRWIPCACSLLAARLLLRIWPCFTVARDVCRLFWRILQSLPNRLLGIQLLDDLEEIVHPFLVA